MRTHCCDDVVCVVNMSSGRGASPFALPFVAGFVVQFRLRFSRIAVVEADCSKLLSTIGVGARRVVGDAAVLVDAKKRVIVRQQ